LRVIADIPDIAGIGGTGKIGLFLQSRAGAKD
jgi:hypothetical protein